MPIGPPSFQPYHLYVGDVPPVPTMPFPPPLPPGFTIPEPQKRVIDVPGGVKPPADTEWIDQLLSLDKKDTAMTVWMIWVTDSTDPSRTPWLEAAWDDESIALNREGWDAALEQSYKDHGGANVRITRTTVDFDKVRAAFEPTEI